MPATIAIRGAASSCRLLLRRVRNSRDIRVRLGKCGVIDPRGNGKREAGGNERERREEDDTVRVHDLIGEDCGRRTEDAKHDADRDFAREGDHVLIVAAYIRRRSCRDGARAADGRCVRGLRGRAERSVVRRDGQRGGGHVAVDDPCGRARHGATAQILPDGNPATGHIPNHQIVQRALEDLAHLDELVHLRVGLLGLPLGDGLTGHPEQHGELLLGHVALCAQILQVGAEAHDGSSRWLGARVRTAQSNSMRRPNSTSSVWRFSCRRLTHYGCRTARTTNLGLHFTQLASTLRLQTAGRQAEGQTRAPR